MGTRLGKCGLLQQSLHFQKEIDHSRSKRIKLKTAIVWFRKDLRLHDHEALHKAIDEADSIIPFYCFEEEEFGKTSFGFDKTGPFRGKFLRESVLDLRKSLKELGNNLCIRRGKTSNQLAKIVNEFQVDKIFTTKDIYPEERSVQQEVESVCKIDMDYSFEACLYHINDLPHDHKNTPSVFTSFRKGVEKKSKVRELYPTPSKMPKPPEGIQWGEVPELADLGIEGREIDKKAAIMAKGGESEALKRLRDYFYNDNALIHYKKTRNGLLGESYSSKFSLWLWNGCISPRKIYWEVKQFEKKVEKNQSTYWLIFELIWRDYFKYVALQNGNRIFQLEGIGNSDRVWEQDWDRFNKWAKGETGIPFIDANMRELNETGFMSNRGRQNVASFLSKELKLDWRMGAEYFESVLIDYDVASNYGNWMYVSGVGNDPRDRYFNIISQAKRYDKQGKYVKNWLPELKLADSAYVHHPWTAQGDLFGKRLDYPKPMVEPDYWEKYY